MSDEITIKLTENKVLNIVRDSEAESPLNWDTEGVFYSWHDTYRLGHFDIEKAASKSLIERLQKDHYVLPVYAYIHGDIVLSSKPFDCPFDSGQIGVIAMSKRKAESFGWDENETLNVLLGELEVFKQYHLGEVYSYSLEQEGEYLDSCCGFYGSDVVKSGMLDYLKENLSPDDVRIVQQRMSPGLRLVDAKY
jgi:hypothetical protein